MKVGEIIGCRQQAPDWPWRLGLRVELKRESPVGELFVLPAPAPRA
jgi:hypothetical protein